MDDFLTMVSRMANSKPITYKQLKESGVIGQKYPYDEVVEAINELSENDTTKSNIQQIIKNGYWKSGKACGYKTLAAKLKSNPKAKQIILELFEENKR